MDDIFSAIEASHKPDCCVNGLATFPGGRKILTEAKAHAERLKVQDKDKLKATELLDSVSVLLEPLTAVSTVEAASITQVSAAWSAMDVGMVEGDISESTLDQIVSSRVRAMISMTLTLTVNLIDSSPRRLLERVRDLERLD